MSADLDDIHATTGNLRHVLAVIHDLVADVYHSEMEPQSRIAADRLGALARLARDEALRIDTAVGDKIEADNLHRDTEVNVIRTLGEEYEEYLAAWTKAAQAADVPDASEELKQAARDAEDRHDTWRNELFNWRSTVPEAIAEKASICFEFGIEPKA